MRSKVFNHTESGANSHVLDRVTDVGTASKRMESQSLKNHKSRDKGYSENEVNENVSKTETWWEEETMRRDLPLTRALNERLSQAIREYPGLTLSYCPELMSKISKEIARISRKEPGGLHACRIFAKVVEDESNIQAQPAIEDKNDLIPIAALNASSGFGVATFEVRVYLFPSKSFLSRIQSAIFSSKKSPKEKLFRGKRQTLSEDFVLVKEKLFRSRSNSIEIIRNIRET